MFDLERRNRPLLKWAGGKSQILPQLLEHFPHDFQRYIEPFFGGGAVYFALAKAVPAVLNDINHEIVAVYETVRDDPLALMRALDELSEKYSEEFYYELRAMLPDDKVKCAARTLFLNKTGFNGLYRQNQKGEFNVPFGKRLRCPALYDRDNLLSISKKLQSARFCCEDFVSILNTAGDGDFVYCDPPYQPLTVTSSFNRYFQRGFDLEDQARLRDACAAATQRGAVVIVSNSTAPAIVELYRNFEMRRVLARRAINSNAFRRGKIEELVVVLKP